MDQIVLKLFKYMVMYAIKRHGVAAILMTCIIHFQHTLRAQLHRDYRFEDIEDDGAAVYDNLLLFESWQLHLQLIQNLLYRT
jgi:hypothetical protein